MAEGAEPVVLVPTSVGEMVEMYAENPDAVLVAGGTETMAGLNRLVGTRAYRPKTVLSLGSVPLLSRISRTQKHLSIGSAVTLSRILSIGPNVIPLCFFDALKTIATPSVRRMATLGGNMRARFCDSTSLVALCALDAHLELRRASSVRWLPVSSSLLGVPDGTLRRERSLPESGSLFNISTISSSRGRRRA